MPKKSPGNAPSLVKLHKPGEHIEGSRASQLNARGEGVHNGYSIAIKPYGVEVEKKSAGVRALLPWNLVRSVQWGTPDPVEK